MVYTRASLFNNPTAGASKFPIVDLVVTNRDGRRVYLEHYERPTLLEIDQILKKRHRQVAKAWPDHYIFVNRAPEPRAAMRFNAKLMIWERINGTGN